MPGIGFTPSGRRQEEAVLAGKNPRRREEKFRRRAGAAPYAVGTTGNAAGKIRVLLFGKTTTLISSNSNDLTCFDIRPNAVNRKMPDFFFSALLLIVDSATSCVT